MKEPDSLDELDKILVDFFNEAEPDVHASNGGTVYTKAGTNAKTKIQAHIKQAKEQLLEQVEAEVIGDNEYGNIGYSGEDMVDDTSEDMIYRNELRAQQRQALQQLKEEL